MFILVFEGAKVYKMPLSAISESEVLSKT